MPRPPRSTSCPIGWASGSGWSSPCLTTTVTVVESPTALPAVPVIEGMWEPMLPLGELTTRPPGAAVSTVKALVELVVELPAASVWVAVMVKVPSASAAAPIDQALPARVGANV